MAAPPRIAGWLTDCLTDCYCGNRRRRLTATNRPPASTRATASASIRARNAPVRASNVVVMDIVGGSISPVAELLLLSLEVSVATPSTLALLVIDVLAEPVTRVSISSAADRPAGNGVS